MSVREFILLAFICLIWGFHYVFLKAVAEIVPPLFYVAMRMGLVALLLSPFLRWRPDQLGKLLGAGFCLGGLHLALIMFGLSMAPASAAAVAVELYTPFATILAIFFLGEKVGWRRGLGVTLAFLGVAIIALQGHAGGSSGGLGDARLIGVLCVAGGAFIEACGSIILKRIKDMRAIEISAFMALIGAIILSGLSFTFETGQLALMQSPERNKIIGVLLYSAVGASLFGHTAYYWLLRRLPIAMVAPSGLIATVIAVIAAVVFLGETATPQLIVGSLTSLVGVAIILVRSGGAAPALGVRGFFFFRRGFQAMMKGGRSFGLTHKSQRRHMREGQASEGQASEGQASEGQALQDQTQERAPHKRGQERKQKRASSKMMKARILPKAAVE
ncbi:MAG: DMT family transporter [Pseudomonadota bacterium]